MPARKEPKRFTCRLASITIKLSGDVDDPAMVQALAKTIKIKDILKEMQVTKWNLILDSPILKVNSDGEVHYWLRAGK
jgi:hypothetical protein